MPLVRESFADEIWSMNHAFKVLGDKLPRLDLLLEIHPEDWFRRKELTSSEEYWAWLQQPHSFPIYMIEKHPLIPASVKYPLDEVNRALFGGKFHLRTGEMIKFYSSSFSYLLALAIYQGFKRVELYGLEMATGTEYAYQYPGGAFMTGVAVGRGVEVVVPEQSMFCRARLYGYENVPYVDRDKVGLYREFYVKRVAELEGAAEYERGRYDDLSQAQAGPDVLSRALSRLQNAHADLAVVRGGLTIVEAILRESDYYTSRQKLEGYASQYAGQAERWKADANYRRAEYNEYVGRDDYNAIRARELFMRQVDAWEVMHKFSGAVQVLEKLMAECDMRVVPMELIRKIEDVGEHEVQAEVGGVA